MKNRLAALGRLAAIFILALVLLVALAVLGRTDAGSSFGELASASVLAIRRLLPLAATLALFLGANGFRKSGHLDLPGFALLLVAGFALMAGGFALRRLGPEAGESIRQSAPPPTGAITDSGDGSIYIGKLEGRQASEVLAWESSASKAPRLVWDSEARLDASGTSITVHGTSMPLGHMAASPAPAPWGRKPGELADERLDSLDALAPGEAGLMVAAFVFLAAGLAGLAGRARWPLAGFFLSITFMAGLCVADLFLSGARASGLYLDLGTRLGLGAIPAHWATAALEALLALVIAPLVLFARHGEEE